MVYKYAFVLVFALLLAAPIGLTWSARVAAQELAFASNAANKTSSTVQAQYVNQSETNQLNSIINTIVSFIKSIVAQLISLFSQQAKSK